MQYSSLAGGTRSRYYVDLSAQQEKVLLKKAERYLKLNKQMRPELTNDIFQQLIYLLAVSWSEISSEGLVAWTGKSLSADQLSLHCLEELDAGKNILGDISPKATMLS